MANASHPVDRFILAALRKAGLKPAEPADRQTLIRRLSFVLTGLPPTPLEVDLFVRDESPGAYARLVDRLLASPHFGEHWARHWMDVMRFAETFGNDWNYEIKGAWLYRDYLIRAFNQDVPYDQLIREHLAGDLLEKPRINAQEGINESLIGTSSLRLGELGHDDCIRFRQIRTDVVDNQIDTLGKAFQGLTVACARCHDHKLDPIPTSDYYALYGALTSSRMVMRNADTPDVNAAAKQRLRDLKPLDSRRSCKTMDSRSRPDSALFDGGTSRLERTSSQAAGSHGSFARPDSGLAHFARETKARDGRTALSVDSIRRHRYRSGMDQAEVPLRRRDAKPRCFQSRELPSFWRS